MPKKVMTLQGLAEIPTNSEMFQQISYINENKQEIWNLLDQFKEKPPNGTNTAFQREVRKINEDIRELERNVWRKEDGRPTLWNFVGSLRTRLDTLEDRLSTLPDAVKSSLREAINAELGQLLEPAVSNITSILEDNRKLREQLVTLRSEIKELRSRIFNCSPTTTN